MSRIDTAASLFLIAWITVLFQGALRKWLFPGFQLLYFIQDVPVLIAYIYALANGILWLGGLSYGFILLAFVLVFQSTIQVIFINYDFASSIMGLHHYLFYLPLTFIVPMCMTRKNIRRFIRLNLLSIPPMSALAFLQIISPRNAWINQTAAGDEVGRAFGVDSVLARSSGTFNFTLSFSIWCGLMAALVIGEWLTPPKRRAFRSSSFLILNTIAMLVTTATSGSRTAVFVVAVAIIGGFFAAFVRNNLSVILSYTGILIVIPLFIGMSYLFAPGNLNALGGRFVNNDAETEMTTRVQTMSIGFITNTEFSWIGEGIAAKIPAAESASNFFYSDPFRGSDMFDYSEWDNIRAVQGLGTPIGSLVVLIRYCASLLVLLAAFKAFTLPGDGSLAHALPLAFTIIPTLAIGDMVHTAPIQQPLILYCVAIISGTLLYQRQAYDSAPMPLMESTARV